MFLETSGFSIPCPMRAFRSSGTGLREVVSVKGVRSIEALRCSEACRASETELCNFEELVRIGE